MSSFFNSAPTPEDEEEKKVNDHLHNRTPQECEGSPFGAQKRETETGNVPHDPLNHQQSDEEALLIQQQEEPYLQEEVASLEQQPETLLPQHQEEIASASQEQREEGPSRAELFLEIARLQTALKTMGYEDLSELRKDSRPSTSPQHLEPHYTRVLSEVVRKEVNTFLSSARRNSICSRCLSDIVESHTEGPQLKRPREEPEETIEGKSSGMGAVLSRVLDTLRREKEKLEKMVQALDKDTIQPLRAEVAQLQAEKSVAELELVKLREELRELSFSSEGSSSSLLAELHQLRASESDLRENLQEVESKSVAKTSEISQVMVECSEASRKLFPLIRRRQEELQKKIQELQLESRIAVLRMEEAERRRERVEEVVFAVGVSSEGSPVFHSEHSTGEVLHQCLASYYAAALQEWEGRYTDVKQEMEKLRVENEQLQKDLAEEKGKQASSKRMRDATDERNDALRVFGSVENGVGGGNSFRTKYLHFWYEGRREIAALKSRVGDLEIKEKNLRVAEGKIAQLEQYKVFMHQQLTELALTVEQLRQREREHRAEQAGYRVERDFLMDSLAMLMRSGEGASHALRREELETCSATIRQAAAKAAAGSAAVVADPQAIAAAERLAQEKKTEVDKLEKQKQKLSQLVSVTKDRVTALLTQEALLRMNAASSTSKVELAQVLEHTRQCAKDIFNDCKKSILGAGNCPVPNTPSGSSTMEKSYLELRQSLDQRLQELRNAHLAFRDLQESHKQLEISSQEAEKTSERTLQEKDTLILTLKQSNEILTEKVTAFHQQLQWLSNEHGHLQHFSQLVVSGLRYVSDFLEVMVKGSGKLRTTVTAMRQDMQRILLKHNGGNGISPGQGGKEVVEALTDLYGQIKERTQLLSVEAGANRTTFLADLVNAIKGQEERLAQLQQNYDSHVESFPQTLAGHLLEAQKHWNSEWKKQFEVADMEKRAMTFREQGQAALYQQLETVCVRNKSVAVEVARQGGELSDSVNETIRAMNQFLKSLATPLAQAPGAATAVEDPNVSSEGLDSFPKPF